MCGIFGAVGGSSDAIDIDAALRTIAHRGPDAAGIWRSRGVVLGHRRLAILDLTPGGSQPMLSADGEVVVVFNGEIYNHHRAARASCARAAISSARARTPRSSSRATAPGATASSSASTACSRSASGTCARQRLLLARDRAGKKPLYYHHRGGVLRFASEVKAIVASGVPGELDPDGAADVARVRLHACAALDVPRHRAAAAGIAAGLRARRRAACPSLLAGAICRRRRSRLDRTRRDRRGAPAGRSRRRAAPRGRRAARCVSLGRRRLDHHRRRHGAASLAGGSRRSRLASPATRASTRPTTRASPPAPSTPSTSSSPSSRRRSTSSSGWSSCTTAHSATHRRSRRRWCPS